MQSSMTPISTPSPEAMYKKYTDLSTLHDPRVDAVLKRAAMGGDPNYPQVYAIMAIQARTAAKGQAQQMQGAQSAQGPQPTVAQNVIAQAAPQVPPSEQGMASLPISSDTFHAAGGGMVSFAHGGNTSSRGDMYQSPEHKKLVKKAAEAKARALAEFGASQTGYNFPSEYVSPAGDGVSSPEMNAMIDASRRQTPQAPAAFSPEQMQALGQSQGAPEQQADNTEAVARTRSMYNVAPPASPGVERVADPRWKGIEGARAGLDALNKQPEGAKAASAKATSDKAPDASTSGKKPAITMAEYNKLAAEGVENRRKPAAVGKINREKPATEVKKDDKKGADKGITALKTNVPQAEKDIAAETAARYHKMVGEDPDAVDRKARMEALGLSNAEEKRKAPWMALANAGFGMMAGPSQYAMQNIGAGAQQGLASLTEQQKDMARAQERHAAMQDAIGERDYARRAKGAELGMTTEATSKKATQDESQFGREIASRERVAGINAAGMQSRIGAQETGIMLRGLDKALVAANNELMLATTKKEKDAIKARIASLTTQMNQYLGMGDMQAGAPDSSSLTATAPGKFTFNL